MLAMCLGFMAVQWPLNEVPIRFAMTDFDDIRPYYDSEVPEVLNRLANDPELHDILLSIKFPRLKRWLSWPLKMLIKQALRRYLVGIETVEHLQVKINDQLEQLLAKVSSGVTVSGLEQLDPKQAYLFISNHRDIAMDPALVDLVLHRYNRDTVRIAIGDNLLTKPYTSDLMRINKSFIVKRSVEGRREKFKALMQLSSYIRYSIQNDNSSIWIAQREGRAKDGKDKTEPALIKMLSLSKQKEHSFDEGLTELNLVPVAISYELDPCDRDKGRELDAVRSSGSYEKGEHEDLSSIYRGLVGIKGHIHVAFGEPVKGVENADEVATEVDRQIFAIYRLHPTNILAYEMLYGSEATVDQWKSEIACDDWSAITEQFNERMESTNDSYRDLVIAMYANPVCSRLASLNQQAPMHN